MVAHNVEKKFPTERAASVLDSDTANRQIFLSVIVLRKRGPRISSTIRTCARRRSPRVSQLAGGEGKSGITKRAAIEMMRVRAPSMENNHLE